MAYVNYPVQPTVLWQSTPESAMMLCDILGPDVTGSLIVLADRDRARTQEGMLHMLARRLRQEAHPTGIDHVVFRLDAHTRQWQEIVSLPQMDERDGYVHVWPQQVGPTMNDPWRTVALTVDRQCIIVDEQLYRPDGGRELHQWRGIDVTTGGDMGLGSPSVTTPDRAVMQASGTGFYECHPNKGRVFTAVDGTFHKFYGPHNEQDYMFPVAAPASSREIGTNLVAACSSLDDMDLLLCTFDPRAHVVHGYVYDMTATHKTVIGTRRDANKEGVFAFRGYCVALTAYAGGWMMAVGDEVVVLDRNGMAVAEVPLMPLSSGRSPIFIDTRMGNGATLAVVVDDSLLCTIVDVATSESADQYLARPVGADGRYADVGNICLSADGAYIYILFTDGSTRWVSAYDISSLYMQRSAMPGGGSTCSRNLVQDHWTSSGGDGNTSAAGKPARSRSHSSSSTGARGSSGARKPASAAKGRKPAKSAEPAETPSFGGWSNWEDDRSASDASRTSSTQNDDDQPSFNGWSSW